MFLEIFLFEMKSWLKKPATYIYFLVFYLLTFLVALGIGGFLGTASFDSNVFINSALAVASIFTDLNTGLIGMVIIVSIMAPAVYKDFQHGLHPLYFTKPITKFGYMFGRFSAVLLISVFVFSGSIFGYITGCSLPGFTPEILGPFSWMNYLQPMLVFVIPNTLLIGAIFFSLVTFSRNMLSGYIGCLVMLILQNIANSLSADLDNRFMAALLEPFGTKALVEITKYWTPVEQNTQMIPLEGVLLYNRLLWLGVAFLVAAFTYFRFSFSQFLSPVKWFWHRNRVDAPSASIGHVHYLSDIPKPFQDFSPRFSLSQTWFLAKFELRRIVRSVFFIVILVLAVLAMIVVVPAMGLIFGTPTFPVTYQILQASNIFTVFTMLMIIFYSGVLVWRERDAKVDELVGSSPVHSAAMFGSKLIALVLMQVLLLIATMITGMGIQMYQGYYNVEPLQYIKELFGFRLISLTLISALCLATQVLSTNRFIGYFLAVLVLILWPFVRLIGWDSGLYLYNYSGFRLQYSDMNGYGHSLYPFFFYRLYWSAFAGLLLIASSLMWTRGKEKSMKKRWKAARLAITGKTKWAAIGVFAIFIGCGGFIYYNTNILNERISAKEQERTQAEFEKKYKRFERTPQPRVVEANLNVEIYPDKRAVGIKGFYYLKNKRKVAVDSILLNIYEEMDIHSIAFDRPAKEVFCDKDNGFYIYHLNNKLNPGDSVKLSLDISFAEKGFTNGPSGTFLVYNGTFFNSAYISSIGYNENVELSDNTARVKYGLPKKERMANVNDSAARMNTYISSDADWIRFECVLGTSADQIAIAPGYLQKEWQENGRRYFHYKMDSKILNFYSFLSARYEVKRDKWIGNGQPVNIEIYYHKGHEYNLDRMVNAIKKSLDYYTKNFSPYQHRQVRIIEFPRYASFAQSFPNTIPFSESIGFIAKMDAKDPESIDYPFYVTAHEVAHQWWAHQVIGGNVKGSTLMCESLAQYSALMVMEKEYGKEAMKKFLKYEMNNYLRGRSFEGKKEMPLMLGENQQYLHYNKGSVVMYALKDYIGEDTLNAALARYIKKTAFQEPPYTNSVEFVSFLKQATPDSLKYIISDMFENITLYENKITKCSYSRTGDGKYLVKFEVESKKMRADSLGWSKAVGVDDWIDVAVFGTKSVGGKNTESELIFRKVRINKEKMSFEMIVDEEPVKVGLDPYNKLVDRHPDDNVRSFNASDGDPVGTDGGVTIKVGG